MEKTLLEKFAEKLADGFIEVGNDMKMLLKISKPTAEGQVLTAKMVDGELQPVWADSGASVPDTPDTPDNTGMFDTLINCEYKNGVLNYTSGDLDSGGGKGYQAVSINPTNIEVTGFSELGDTIYICIGESTELAEYASGFAKGLILFPEYNGTRFNVLIGLENNYIPNQLSCSKNDKIEVTIADSKATITNVTTGQSSTTEPSEYLANPKYLNVTVFGTSPLPIKAI